MLGYARDVLTDCDALREVPDDLPIPGDIASSGGYRRLVTTINCGQLVESARDFADRALTAYADGDSRVILQQAAISLEHLSKAYLASLSPVLLMEIRGGNFDSLLHLAGLGQRTKKTYPRTISAREALARVKYVLPALQAPSDELAQLIDVRDGVVHVGYLAAASTRELLTAYLRFANEIYEELGVPGGDRWGSHSNLVDSLISQSLTEIEHDVQRKIAAAKRFISELMDSIPKEAQDTVGAARQADWLRMLPSMGHSEEITCPACNHQAKCFGSVSSSIDAHAASIGASITHIFLVGRLICGVCNLRLEDPDEIRAAGVNQSWALENYHSEAPTT